MLTNEIDVSDLCRNCHLPITKPPLCRCMGKGGGSGEGGEEKAEMKATSQLQDETKFKPLKDTAKEIVIADKEIESNLDTSDLGLLIELKLKQLLVIDDNKNLGTLTLKCHPDLFKGNILSPAQQLKLKNIFENIEQVCRDFFAVHKLSNENIHVEKDNKGNILLLRVSILNPDLYDKLIKQLEDKKLLPIELAHFHQEDLYHPTQDANRSRLTPWKDISKGPQPR